MAEVFEIESVEESDVDERISCTYESAAELERALLKRIRVE